MSSLLEQVLKNKANPTAESALSPSVDEAHSLPDGSQIFDSTIAAVNRILSLNPHLHKRPSNTSSHPYDLYNGHTPVDLADKRTFLSLLHADWIPRTPHQTVLLIEYVEKLVPTLSRDCIAISGNLIWDRANSVLREATEEDKIKTVS